MQNFFLNGHFLYYPISQRTLKRIFDFHHIEIKPKKSAPKKVIPNEKKNIYHNFMNTYVVVKRSFIIQLRRLEMM